MKELAGEMVNLNRVTLPAGFRYFLILPLKKCRKVISKLNFIKFITEVSGARELVVLSAISNTLHQAWQLTLWCRNILLNFSTSCI
jgi:hypothetical protein